MNKQFGHLTDEKGIYVLDKIPEAGNFEYIYKNKNIFLKVDQFGPSYIQLNPPVGMTVLKRNDREQFSPWKYYFKVGNKVTHNFDIYSAKKIRITYKPTEAIYWLSFGNVEVETHIFVDIESSEVFMDVKFKSNIAKNVSLLSVVYLNPVDSSMAVWDKQEWYQSTELIGKNNSIFLTKHYSVRADINDRKNIFLLSNQKTISNQNLAEKLISITKNFNVIPSSLGNEEIKKASCYSQVCSSLYNLSIDCSLKTMLKVCNDDEKIDEEQIYNKLTDNYFNFVLKSNANKYSELISRRFVKTSDDYFNKFVNYFLPQELEWVISLDRGWPTGMRGSRDCANDFLGYLAYDVAECRNTIKTLFSNQRFEDGWFPRQIPFGNSNKYDLRPFVDSNAFVIELIYEYLSYSNDFSILNDSYPYLNSTNYGTGLEHLIKACQFYNMKSNLGEHGLIKLNGGDWLDCLNQVGLKGKGETVMVSCQAVLAFQQVKEILMKYDEHKSFIEIIDANSKKLIKNIKKYSYLEKEGFYKAIYSDDGNWYFSDCDIDGKLRVYVPTNSYTIIAGIDHSNDKRVINRINFYNETNNGYKLFTTPFGEKPFNGIGKMGTGDFQPYMFENGAVYNHGGNLFYCRALAIAKDYNTLYKALNYSLPINPKFHAESISCLPLYACTNAYNLMPSYKGRGGLSFLTGSIAMIERVIYNWMFGLDYHIDYIKISPCIPKQYKDSFVKETYNNLAIEIQYFGFGSKIQKAIINGIEIEHQKHDLIIPKKDINSNLKIEIYLK